MSLIIEFFNNVLYIMCYVCVGQLFFNYPRRCFKHENVIMLFMALFATIVMSSDLLWLRIIVHIVLFMIVLELYFKIKIKTIVGFYFGVIAALSMLTTMFAMVVGEIINYSKLSINEHYINFLAHSLLLLYLFVIGKYFQKRYPNGIKTIETPYLFLFVVILIVDAAIVVLLDEYVINAVQTSRKLLLIIVYVGVVVGILVQLVLLINTLVTRNVHKENEKLAKQFLESQNEHYQYLEKREHETKKFRHDIKNHLLLLENLLNTGKYEEAEAYLNTINEKVSSFNNQISVNNGIADAILNRFYTEAKEKGIALKVSGHFPLECHITAYDICTIFSNLLSNAIRAEIESEGNEILVIIKYTDDKLLLTVENDYAHELNEVDGVFKTTKEDALGHGYGLSNVTECVEKNGGNISISTDNHRFKARIIMLNAKEEML